MKILKAMKHCVFVAAALVPTLGLYGCPDDGMMEEAGENVDEGIEDAGEAIEDAGEEIEDAVDE